MYYAEAQQKIENEKRILSNQYRIMIRRLWRIITFPSAIIATTTGILLLMIQPAFLQSGWMLLKLGFVLLLWIYHLICGRYVRQTQEDTLVKSSDFMRIWNEGATLILFSIVFLVVMKSALNWIFGVGSLVGLSVLLMLGIRIYKRMRD